MRIDRTKLLETRLAEAARCNAAALRAAEAGDKAAAYDYVAQAFAHCDAADAMVSAQ